MKKREYRDYLDDIIGSADDVASFIHGMSFEEFQHDKKTVNAVVRSFEIIGEAARHVPKSVRDKAPDVPWKEIVGMRNKSMNTLALITRLFGIQHEGFYQSLNECYPNS